MTQAVAEFLLCCLASLVCSTQQVVISNFNPNTDGVVELTQTNFRTLVLNSNDKWLCIFLFSGPGCLPCIQASELIKKAAPLLKEKKIKIGFVDNNSPDGKKLIDAYGIKMFPKLYLFGEDKEYPIPFSTYVKNSAEEFARSVELNLNRSRPSEGICGQDSAEDVEDNLYELTDENFEDVVLNCEEPVLVNFNVPDVAVCAQFIPNFNAAAKKFRGRAMFGSFFQIGSTVAEKYGVSKVCTVKLFPAGDKSGSPLDYNNGTHSTAINANIVPWLKNALAGSKPAPEIYELSKQDVLESKCKNSGVSSCIFLFLANKCDASCQSTSLDQLKQLANDMKAENWAWFWTTQGTQTAFEQAFGLQYLPGVIAVDLQSQTFSITRSTTSMTKVKEFAQSHASGILPSKAFPTSGFPKLKV